MRSINRWRPTMAVIAAVAAIAACGERVDPRIAQIHSGMPRDSVLATLGGTAADSMPFVYDVGNYLVNGRSLEVFYFDAEGRRRYRDTVAGGELTPVVLEKGSVTGTGWSHWDSVASSLKIVPPAH